MAHAYRGPRAQIPCCKLHINNSCLISCSSHFTLHGLWPNYEKGQCPGKRGAWPQNCDDSSTDLPPECDCPFDLSLLSDLQSSMLVNWPSYGQRNALFWKHEWDKHGMPTSNDAHTITPELPQGFLTTLTLLHLWQLKHCFFRII